MDKKKMFKYWSSSCKMIVVAFDIGSKNFAWASVFYADSKEMIPFVDKSINSDVQIRIKEKMNILNMDVCDISQDSSKNSLQLYRNLHQYMINHMYVWSSADVFLVEQQMSTGKVNNIRAIKISQHVLAFFINHFPHHKIVEYCANYKTSLFNVRIKEKRLRKIWSIDKVNEIIQDDPISMDFLGSFPKKDDICDCILMTFTFAFSNWSKKSF